MTHRSSAGSSPVSVGMVLALLSSGLQAVQISVHLGAATGGCRAHCLRQVHVNIDRKLDLPVVLVQLRSFCQDISIPLCVRACLCASSRRRRRESARLAGTTARQDGGEEKTVEERAGDGELHDQPVL